VRAFVVVAFFSAYGWGGGAADLPGPAFVVFAIFVNDCKSSGSVSGRIVDSDALICVCALARPETCGVQRVYPR
jgi:hypothetical protein